ncbi:tripartite tricarboxylate transporter substrate binding protein [Ramlibacter henchirensis]|uniref:Tripartite tricarboxylate transporter substrate binding protein n=1 Tax=Ramlibacter henchirensis TaxID=204072 RepID=A0A4Z0C5J4_9BURK|nr:tripartite tricarboxylate transporter substrate binding protein [Ramlibacter henchirensis]TFZ06172.1 tripartite tricarboxylate transporter substrate binding protein [Ramlibacter henchirensis]
MNSHTILTRRQLVVVAAGAAASLATGVSFAQGGYPNRPVKVIVTYTPGGANDVTARVYSQLLGERLKQAFVVENRPGASGIPGTTSVAKAEADGYTLLLGAGGTMTINPGLFPSLSYDPLRDFVPIGLAARSPLVLVVPPSLPVRSVAELIAYAKSKPDGISFASPGAGTPLHLAAELFTRQAGIKALHVPYKGSAPALNDLMGGRVDMMCDVLGTSIELVRAGKLRALAVTSPQRSNQLPQVPTLAEQGLKDFDVTSWFGFFAPASTPREIVSALNAELARVAQTSDARDKLAPLGMEPVSSSSEQLRALVQSEQAKWREVIRAANVKAD